MISICRFPFRRTTAATALSAFVLAFLPVAPASARADEPTPSPLVIQHDPLACVTTSAAPLVDATITPDRELSKSFVYFRAAGTEDFYYVAMAGTPPSVEGVLPRPLPETKNIEYYVRATDLSRLSKKTPEYMPPVVDDNVCRTRGKPVAASGAGLTVGLTREGQSPVPPGFDKRDIAFVVLFSGAVVTLAAALQAAGTAGSAAGAGASGTAAASGGVSTGVIVGGGVVVAAGAVAIVANNNKSSSSNSPPTITISASPTTGSAPLYVAFTSTVTDKENDTPFTVQWSFGDGGTATGLTTSHTYAGTGNFNVTATATDSKNKTGTSNSLTISIPGPQAIVAGVSWAGHAGLAIQVLDPSGASVGTPQGPDPCSNQETTRTEQVVLDAPNLAAGTYTVNVTGTACPGSPAPASVTAVGSVVTSAGVMKCGATQIAVPIPPSGTSSPVLLCTFTVP
jgi:PKD repeat protein